MPTTSASWSAPSTKPASFRRDGQETLGYSDIANFAGTGQTMTVPSLIGSAFFLQKRVRKGGNFMAQWKPSDSLEFDFSGLYTHLDANNTNSNFMMWGSQLGGTTPTAYTHRRQPRRRQDLRPPRRRGRQWPVRTRLSRTISSVPRTPILTTLNLDMTWQPTDKLTVKGQVGYTHGDGDTDDTAAWETYWQGTGASYKLGKVTDVSYPNLPSTVASYPQQLL